MNGSRSLLAACCLLSFASTLRAGVPFEVPFRANMGGPDVVDAYGRLWRGDPGVNQDVLGIRPIDTGGGNVVPAASWCSATSTAPIELGYDTVAGTPATLPQNSAMFQSIRYGNGVPAAYDIAIPIANGEYLVNLYFCEACCPNRHETVTIEGVVVAADVHANQYAAGTQQVGRLGFLVEVADDVLDINFAGCLDPACPGGGDANAILSALEVVAPDYTVCGEPGVGECPSGFACAADPGAGTVTLSWVLPPCGLSLTGFEVRRNGETLATLGTDQSSYVDSPSGRLNVYELVSLSDGGGAGGGCPVLTCSAAIESIPFDVPVRINLGGPPTVDELGRSWLGDQGAGADSLAIRPLDNGGFNTIEAWCSQAPTPVELGYDNGAGVTATLPANSLQFRSIRWDIGADADVYALEIRVPNGEYQLSLFFCESCCPNRHFTVSVQGVVVSMDTHAASYATGPQQTGRIGVPGVVVDGGEGSDNGILRVELVGCLDPLCAGGTDGNPILNALEIVPSGFTACDDPGAGQCAGGLACVADPESGAVSGTWVAPLCGGTITGYEVLRNGELLAELPASATSFEDDPAARFNVYEVVPLSDGGGAGDGADCPTLVCEAVSLAHPFALPLRINLGGDTTLDSRGDLWLGDRPCGLAENADPLGTRPDDNGGEHAICNWCAPIPSSIDDLGFDSTHPGDLHIFSTIRWDDAAIAPIYTLVLPLGQSGEYDVQLFFNECCCVGRHFKVEIQGEVRNADVSYEDYNPMAPALGAAGRLRFARVAVCDDGLLTIRLLPCPDPECMGSVDANAILNALLVNRTGAVTPNNAPNARVRVRPGNTVFVAGGEALVTLDGALSDDGDNGTQGLSYAWSQVDPPNSPLGGNRFATPTASATDVTIVQGPGVYRFRLAIDDGQACNGEASAEVEVTVLEGVRFVRGDVDSSGTIELTDGVVGLNFLFLGGTPPACFDAADTDDNGNVDLTDSVRIFNWLFLGGAAPLEPSPSTGSYSAADCGLDPLDDALDCAAAALTCQ